MLKQIPLLVFSLTFSNSIFWGCGASDDSREASAGSLSADDDIAKASVGASFIESIDSLSDSNMVATSGTALQLANTNSVTKTCEVAAEKAIVQINHNRENSWERTTKRMTLAASMTMDKAVTRTWSKAGTSIACKNNSAAVDFESDLSGLQVDIAIDREAKRSFEQTIIKTGEKTSSSNESSVKGTRQVQWLSQTSNADGSISRDKTISFSTTRSMTIVNKKAETKSIDLTVATEAAAPLAVTVTWDKLEKSRTLLSQRIKSGSIKASKAGSGSIVTTFSDILLSFSESTCQFTSGSLEAKIYEEGSSTATQTFKLTATEGEITVQDVTDAANPKEVEDFEYSPCDLKDFQY